MTKIDANLGKKPADEKLNPVEEESLQEKESHNNSTGVKGQEGQEGGVTPIILIGGVDLVGGVGTAKNDSPTPLCCLRQDETFNWMAIRRTGMCQMILSLIAIVCILVTMTSNGLSNHRFTQFILTVFLFMTGHSGFKGSSKSYKHLIFYMIMSALQWMISVLILSCLTFAIYEAPYYSRYYSHIDFDYDALGIGVLVADLVGTGALIGTVVTGMLGLTACCRGFGNLLAKQEKIFLERRMSGETA